MIDKKVIVTSSILFFGLLIIYIVLSNMKPLVSNSINYVPLNDGKKYFQIQNTITQNIEEEHYYDTPIFIAKSINYDTYENRTYYFINGYILDNTYNDEVRYVKDVNYFMIVKGTTYKLEKINTDIATFAKSIDKTKYDFSSGELLTITSYTEKGKISSYIANYVNLLSVDQNEASKLINYTKNNLSPIIKSYSRDVKENEIIYNVVDSNSNKLEIHEYKIMDYYIKVK